MSSHTIKVMIMVKFNEIKTKKELANFLSISLSSLNYMLYSRKVDNYYESFEIDKKMVV